MTSQHLPSEEAALPTRQELIDFIVKLVERAQGPYPLDDDTEHEQALDRPAQRGLCTVQGFGRDASCVGDLLRHHSRYVYQFEVDNLDFPVDGHPSFTELSSDWSSAGKGQKKDRTRFPEVRSGRGTVNFPACTVRCTCSKCERGKPVELQCEPHAFGSERGSKPQILVHLLTEETHTRAIILGSGDGQGEYFLWGTHPTVQNSMAYNEKILLKQISQFPETRPMPPGREGAGKRRAPDSTRSREEVAQHKRARQDEATPRPQLFSRESTLVIRGSSVASDTIRVARRQYKVEDESATHGQVEHDQPSDLISFSPIVDLHDSTRSIDLLANKFAPLQPRSTRFTRQPANPLFGGASKVPQHSMPSTRRAYMSNSDMVPPVAAPPSQSQQRDEKVFLQPQKPEPAANTQNPAVPNLNQTYNIIRDHVVDQEDDSGLPVMLSNDKLSKYLHILEAAANKGDEFLFRLMREKLDAELAKSGVTKTTAV